MYNFVHSNFPFFVHSYSIIYTDIIEKKFVEKHKDELAENIELTKNVINEIKQEYYNNINNVTWLSDETKQKALKKLDYLKVRVGYPEKFEMISDQYQLKLYEEGSNLVENFINIYQVCHKNSINKVFSEPNDEIWDFAVDKVNAYYYSLDNSINVPLATMYLVDKNADYYEILGTIGTIVGHEITHAFDFSGSKYDEFGNYTNWWAEEDLETFNQKKQSVINYYKKFKFNGKELNAELQAGENMADLGSLETIMNLLKKKDATAEDYKRLFENYAYLWASEMTDQYYNNFMINDEHAPDKIRVNGALSNIDKFYEIYDIKFGDGMYIDPSERIHIWTD